LQLRTVIAVSGHIELAVTEAEVTSMDDDPDLEPDVADEVENTKKQRVSLSPEPSSSKVLPGDSEEVILQYCDAISPE
jgi:hypothetical protein